MRGFNGSLLVCSESTKDFIDGFDKIRVVKGAPDVTILDEMGAYEKVTAIGGGAVIDTAKILAKNPIVCYPTTAAGSTETSWSVYWDGSKKCSIKRMIPKKYYSKLFLCNKFMAFVNKAKPNTFSHTKGEHPRLIIPL